jgi:hypothetical protein
MNPQKKSVTVLFNPFYYIAGAPALGLGLAAILLAGLVGSLGNTHFDGVLDTHSGASAPLWFFLSEGIIDWLCMGVVLWLCGKMISQSAFRALDLLGTQALARWPTLLIALLTLPPAFQRFTKELLALLTHGNSQLNIFDLVVFAAIVIAMIPLVCWMVALMYRAFSVSCNVTGGKAIGAFIAAIIIAEILSKLCLYLAVQHTTIVKPASPLTADVPVVVAGQGAGDIGGLVGAGETAATGLTGFDDMHWSGHEMRGFHASQRQNGAIRCN